jgi:hypothetical protein
VSSLLYRNLTVAYLWYVGWLEAKGMMVSINMGFLNIRYSLIHSTHNGDDAPQNYHSHITESDCDVTLEKI